MATTTSTMTSGVDKPWTLTKELATQTFNATLTTNGKYLDRDINITISVSQNRGIGGFFRKLFKGKQEQQK